MPSTRSGRFVAAPSSVIEIDEVFEARIDVRPGDRVEAREQRALGVGVLDDRFDDVVGVGESIDARSPSMRRPSVASRSAAVSLPFSTNLPRLFSIAVARAIEHRLRDVDEPHGEAGLREHLRDAVAHRAGADDADCLDHVATLITLTSRHDDRARTIVFFVSCERRSVRQARSTASATPLPPPRQSVAMPRFRFRRFSA